jgi:hypothetical protein
MGVYAGDNQLNYLNLRCWVEDSNKVASTLWGTVNLFAGADGLPLSQVELIPTGDVPASMTFTFTCNGVVTPFSYNPEAIRGYLGL